MIKLIFKRSDDYLVPLASKENLKKDCPTAIVPLIRLWKNDSFLNKAKSILKLRYSPNEELIQKIAHEIFLEDLFGSSDDLAESLLGLMIWHQNRNWELLNLEERDNEKADALEGMTDLSRKRYWEYTSPSLNLRLIHRQPIITPVVYPLVAKIPVRSIQYFVDIHSRYAFDRIRKSNHEFGEELISYLYDVLILNQKSANGLHKIIYHIDDTKRNKKKSILLRSEIDAISEIDILVTCLKASVEKITSLVGYTLKVPRLEEKKEHKKRINSLLYSVQDDIKSQPNFEFFIEHISSNQLEKLNNLRTGLLHKRGIAKNQPHEFFGSNKGNNTLVDMFNFLFDQHCKNSTILLASLSLLCDELIKLDKPDFDKSDIPVMSLITGLKEIRKSR